MRNSMRRSSRHAGVALDHRVLHFDRAAHRVDDAAELDERPVAGALDDAPVMHGDGGIDQIAAQRPQPRQDAILVRAGEPAVADDVGDQDRRDFPGLAHRAPPLWATSGSAANASRRSRLFMWTRRSSMAIPVRPSATQAAGSHSVRLDRFARPSPNDCYLRIALKNPLCDESD